MSLFDVASIGVRSLGDDIARNVADDVVRAVGDDVARSVGDDVGRLGDDVVRGPFDDLAFEFGDDAARLGDDAARFGDDVDTVVAKPTIPAKYDVDLAMSAYGDDATLRAPGGYDELADEMDNAIWLDGLDLTPEGVVRYRYGGPAGVLEDPARFTIGHDYLDLSGYPGLQQRFQPHRVIDDGWRSIDDLSTSSWLDDFSSPPSSSALDATPGYETWAPDPFTLGYDDAGSVGTSFDLF